MTAQPTALGETGKAGAGSHWSGSDAWHAPALARIEAADVRHFAPGLDLWDCWPLQHEDGTTVDCDGEQYWFFLSAPQFDDPAERHMHARIRLFRRAGDGWVDLGHPLGDVPMPGNAEWAGSAVLAPDGMQATLFFTASGRKGGGPSVEQRIFASEARFAPGSGLTAWQTPQELFRADGQIYQIANQSGGAPGTIKGFRDPAWFRDPATDEAWLLFTGSAGWSADPHNGLIGCARFTPHGWQPGPPLIDAVGVNNELERPHMLVRDGRYYLFWSTQRHTFSPAVTAGPNGLYGAVAERFDGPWRPVNGDGLVACNPADEPTQAYSWWVTGENEVWSFIDQWGMGGRALSDHPELARSRFGGTPAPRFRLAFAGDRVTVAG